MKTQKKNDRNFFFQARNNRWKWMAGATAATAAGVTAAQAGTITINLVGNYISGSGGNHLNSDLTGDGQPDLIIAGAFYRFSRNSTPSATPYQTHGTARVDLNGVHAFAYHSGQYPLGTVRVGSKSGHWAAGSGTASLNDSIPITFKDLHINNGALTTGSLEVTVSVFGPHGPGDIQLDKLTYNTPNNVPDQGSTLALLAIGA